LPVAVVEALADLKYAGLVVRYANRHAFLPEIVSLHTRKELAAIDGLGPVGIRHIQRWLRQQGRRLRRRDESLDAVICGFGVPGAKAARAQIRSDRLERLHGG
jgi:hypothetical protein